MSKRTITFSLSIFFALLLVCFGLQLSGILMICRSGLAMRPAYQPNELLLASSVKKIKVGDVIYLLRPDNGQKDILRIVAFQYDTIEFNGGYLLRNGCIADKPWQLYQTYYIKRQLVGNKIDDIKEFAIALKTDSLILSLTLNQFKRLSRTYRIRRYSGSVNRHLQPIVIPKDYCFTLADNRNCTDSRSFGLTPLKNIKGILLSQR